MRRAPLVASLAAALTVACATGACTTMSGVDEMAIRVTVPAPTEPAPGDGGGISPFISPPAGDAGTDAPPPIDSGNFIPNGLVTCGAEGTWTSCDPTFSTASCDVQCAQRGRTCVEDCCAYDGSSTIDYRAKTGMVYAILTECSYNSMSSSSSFGSCTTPPVLAGAAGLFEVRCCCK